MGDNLLPSQTVIIGGAALIVGLLIGFLLGRPGYDDPNEKIAALEAQIAEAASGTETVTKAVTALDERVAEMGTRFDAIDSGLGEGIASVQDSMASGFASVGETLSAQAEAADARSESLLGSISGMGEGLTATIAAAGAAAVAAAASTGEADAGEAAEAAPAAEAEQTDGAAAAVEGAQDAPAAEPEAEAVAEAAEEAPNTSAATTASEPARPGQTRTLADGEIRAFVSRIDAEAGRATLAVNGLDRITLSAGRSTEMAGLSGGACLVGLAGITEDGAASVSASCGDQRPEAVGYGPGQTAVLGNARVFVSKAADGAARIAINGQSVQMIEVGGEASVEGARCSVRLEGTDRGMADFSSDC